MTKFSILICYLFIVLLLFLVLGLYRQYTHWITICIHSWLIYFRGGFFTDPPIQKAQFLPFCIIIVHSVDGWSICQFANQAEICAPSLLSEIATNITADCAASMPGWNCAPSHCSSFTASGGRKEEFRKRSVVLSISLKSLLMISLAGTSGKYSLPSSVI